MKTANEIIGELMKSESGAAAVACLGTDGMRQLLDKRESDALEAAAVLCENEMNAYRDAAMCELDADMALNMRMVSDQLESSAKQIRAMKPEGR
jgi:hypothetical protein